MACAASTEEDWLRKRNETQEEHIFHLFFFCSADDRTAAEKRGTVFR